jgi:ADP-heptose:LPS heptosyltransferase
MINYQCRYYRASKPCVFNKTDGSECPSCTHVAQFNERILFIKLDAIGDVLRSASLLPMIAARHDAPYIAWLTRRESVDLVGMFERVDEVIELSEVGLARIATGGWDCVYSLSNDLPSASLATMAAKDDRVVGYDLQRGVIRPSCNAAEHWLEMAAFDRVKRENTASYQRRMLAILDYSGPFEPPRLRVPGDLRAAAASRLAALFPGSTRRRVAVNIGAGGRWPKKMLDVAQIHHLIGLVRQRVDVDVMLVGGAAEAGKADAVLALCGGDPRVRPALTTVSIPEFVSILMEADTLFCGDTLALHVATAIGLPTVSIFGPTSAAEIADFDGLIAKATATGLDCLGCYGDCQKSRNCMTLLDLGRLASMIGARLALSGRTGSSGSHRA